MSADAPEDVPDEVLVTGAPTGVEATGVRSGASEFVVCCALFLLRLLEFPAFAGSTSRSPDEDLLVVVSVLSVRAVWRLTRRGRVEPEDCAWAASMVKIKREAKRARMRCR